MSQRNGRGLIIAGAIVTWIGLCIVMVRLLRVPEYFVPLMVGLGLLVLGVIRRVGSRP